MILKYTMHVPHESMSIECTLNQLGNDFFLKPANFMLINYFLLYVRYCTMISMILVNFGAREYKSFRDTFRDKNMHRYICYLINTHKLSTHCKS